MKVNSILQIQQTIRRDLAHAQIIGVAHRLKTVIDYDRVLVLSDGEVVEFDTPTALLQQSGSVFGELCRKSADWPLLRQIAEGTSSQSSE
jgi:ABC-type multidrug transport system fused ATPase/permease subunit